MDRVLDCRFFRRFGVEIELNTTSGIIKDISEDSREIPEGSERVAHVIKKTLQENVKIESWNPTYNNVAWVVKPDSSCGIEVCSPVLKGWSGLSSLLRVSQALAKAGFRADDRCSFHVHVDIADLNKHQLASIIAWYIKCEHVLLDSVPPSRKLNRYCQPIGMSNIFCENQKISPDELIYKLSEYKYYSMNTYHFVKGGCFHKGNSRKQTIEFRIAENEVCLNPFFIKNWVRLLLHFIQMTRYRGIPKQFIEGNEWTGLLWLNPKQVFEVLKFNEPLSEGLQQVKNWFISRLRKNTLGTGLPGIFSDEGRRVVAADYAEFPLIEAEPSDDLLFGNNYII